MLNRIYDIMMELDSSAVRAFRRAVATKNLLFRAPPCFGRYVKPLVHAAFAVVSTHQAPLGQRGRLWPVLLMCNPKGRPVLQQWGH
jgi:hypothetical protein